MKWKSRKQSSQLQGSENPDTPSQMSQAMPTMLTQGSASLGLTESLPPLNHVIVRMWDTPRLKEVGQLGDHDPSSPECQDHHNQGSRRCLQCGEPH